jgi:hypothetical protein
MPTTPLSEDSLPILALETVDAEPLEPDPPFLAPP